MYPDNFKKVTEIVNLNRKKAIIFLNLDEKFLIIILCLLINFNIYPEIGKKDIILIGEIWLNRKSNMNGGLYNLIFRIINYV